MEVKKPSQRRWTHSNGGVILMNWKLIPKCLPDYRRSHAS